MYTKYKVVSVRAAKEGGSIGVVEGYRKKGNQVGMKRDDRG